MISKRSGGTGTALSPGVGTPEELPEAVIPAGRPEDGGVDDDEEDAWPMAHSAVSMERDPESCSSISLDEFEFSLPPEGADPPPGRA